MHLFVSLLVSSGSVDGTRNPIRSGDTGRRSCLETTNGMIDSRATWSEDASVDSVGNLFVCGRGPSVSKTLDRVLEIGRIPPTGHDAFVEYVSR